MDIVGSYLSRAISFRAALEEFRAWTASRDSVLGEEQILSPFRRLKRGLRLLVGRRSKVKVN